MLKQQLERLVPGFVRVEVTGNEQVRGAQSGALTIPIDHDFDDKNFRWSSRGERRPHYLLSCP